MMCAPPVRKNAGRRILPVLLCVAAVTVCNPAPAAGARTDGSVTAATPEIQALAAALDHDPLRMLEYVRDTIDFECVWSSRRDATQTMLDRTGGVFDQCSLLIALLRAAGHTAEYVHGTVTLATATTANWIGCAEDRITVGNNLIVGAVPVVGVGADSITFEHLWVALNTDRGDVLLDPALKQYRYTAPTDVAAAGYDQDALRAALATGATVTPDYQQNLDTAAFEEALNDLAANLIAHFDAADPHAALAALAGGREIDRLPVTELPASLPYIASEIQRFTDIPARFRTTVTFTVPGGAQYQAEWTELLYRRITCNYAGGRPELRVDGDLKATGAAGTSGTLQIRIDSPILSSARSFTKSLYDFRTHAVVLNAGHVSARAVAERSRRLQEARAAGLGEDAEAVAGEIQNVLGLSHFNQVSLYSTLMARLNGLGPHRILGCLVVAGVGIDALLDVRNVYPDNHDMDDLGRAHKLAYSSFTSCSEHGSIEQTQDVGAAMSTVKGLALAALDGQKIFTVTAANRNAVLPQLNYSNSFKSTLGSWLDAGYNVTIPQNDVTLNAWTGKPWLVWKPDGSGYVYQITGPAAILRRRGDVPEETTSGGSGTSPDDALQNLTHFLNDFASGDLSALTTLDSPMVAEPIDAFSGALIHRQPGLVYYQGRGPQLDLRLTYNSTQAAVDAGVGYGWRHRYQVEVRDGASDPGRALRRGTAYDGVAAAVAAYAATQLLRGVGDTVPHDRLLASILVHKWLMDQLTRTAVRVIGPEVTQQFLLLPDGSYSHPAGIFSELAHDGDAYTLTTKHRAVYRFNPDGSLASLTDPAGNTLALTYSDGRLERITDASGRALMLAYNGDGRLHEVRDVLDRTLGFDYDISGNLVTYTHADGTSTAYAYDAYHRILTAVDARQNTFMTNQYDSFGRVTEQRDGRGKPTRFRYTGYVTETEDPLGNVTRYEFRHNGRLQSETDPSGNLSERAHNGQGLLLEYTGRDGETTTVTYDKRGNPETIVTPRGKLTHYSYDAQNRRTETVDAAGNTWSCEYGPGGVLAKLIDPLLKETVFEYNDFGQVRRTTDPDGVFTEYRYDAAGHNTRIDIGPRQSITFTYDAAGRRLTRTDGRGNTTTYVYDARDRITEIRAPLERTATFAYDGNGNLTTAHSAAGQETVFTYDANNRVVDVADTAGNSTAYQYDDAGKLRFVTDRRGHTTELRYDQPGRVRERITAEGLVSTFQYTPAGRLRTFVDPRGHTTQATYAAMGLKTEALDPLANRRGYDYDDLNRLACLTLPGNRSFTLEYDEASRTAAVSDPLTHRYEYHRTDAGRLRQLLYPNAAGVSFDYDAGGFLETFRDALDATAVYTRNADNLPERLTRRNGAVLEFGYDAAARLTSITAGGRAAIAYSYDKDDRFRSVTNTAGTVTYTYDALGRVSSVNDVHGREAGFTRDENGNLKPLVLPGGRTLTYAYDRDNRLVTLTDWHDRSVTYEYDGLSNVTRIRYPNGVVTDQTYDDAGHLTGLTHTGPGGVLAAYAITRDARGLVTSVAADPPLSAAPELGVDTASYNAANRTQSRNGNAYQYDASGYLNSGGGRSFAYDEFGNLDSVQTGATTVAVGVDGLGNLVRVSSGSDANEYLTVNERQGGRILAEFAGDGSPAAFYVHGFGLTARIDPAGGVRYCHSDFRGNIVALTDGTGQVTDTYAYTPYGVPLARTGTTDQPFRFGGQLGLLTLDGAGLVWMRSRWYDPAAARFISEDPVGFRGGFNLYAYAGNDPVNFVDPTGGAAEPVAQAMGDLNEFLQNARSGVYLQAETVSEHLYRQYTKRHRNFLAEEIHIFEDYIAERRGYLKSIDAQSAELKSIMSTVKNEQLRSHLETHYLRQRRDYSSFELEIDRAEKMVQDFNAALTHIQNGTATPDLLVYLERELEATQNGYGNAPPSVEGYVRWKIGTSVSAGPRIDPPGLSSVAATTYEDPYYTPGQHTVLPGSSGDAATAQ